MRNPDRLVPFYDRVEKLHRTFCPDWRVGQLLMNFISWLGRDPYYMEDEELLKKIDEYFEATFF